MACQFSRSRFNDMITVWTQRIQTLLGTGMRKHIQVHGWSDKHRCLRWQISRDQHIVCYAICHFTNGRSRRRRYQHSICPKPQVYVAVPRSVPLGKKLTDNRLTGQSGQSYRSNKLLSGRSNYDLYLRSLFNQAAYNVASLISSNATGNAKYNFLSVQHSYFPVNSRRRIFVNMAFVFSVKSLLRIQL